MSNIDMKKILESPTCWGPITGKLEDVEIAVSVRLQAIDMMEEAYAFFYPRLSDEGIERFQLTIKALKSELPAEFFLKYSQVLSRFDSFTTAYKTDPFFHKEIISIIDRVK